MKIFVVTHVILEFIAHAKKPPINTHADVVGGTRGLNFDQRLHQHPNFVYASSEGLGESYSPDPSLRDIAIVC